MSSRDFIMKIGGVVDPSLKKAFTSSSKEMQKLSNEMKDMKKQERAFKALSKTSLKMENEFKTLTNTNSKLKEQFESNRTEYKKHQQELWATSEKVKQLKKQLDQAKKPTKSLINEFNKAKKAEEKLKISILNQKKALAEKMREMKKAKDETVKYSREQEKISEKVKKTRVEHEKLSKEMKKVREEQLKLEKYKDLKQSVSDNARGTFARSSIQAATIGAAVKFAIDDEEAFADVRKTTGLAGEEAKEFKKELKAATKDIPKFNSEIYEIAAAAGQAGINLEEIPKFAADTAKVSVAFDMDANTSGETLATWREAFKMNQKEVMVLADQMNLLGDNIKVKPAQVAALTTEIGPLGKMANFTEAQTAALGGTLIALGVKDAGVASTAMRKLYGPLASGESATKGVTSAFKKMGLDAVQVSKDLQKDSEGTLMKVFEGLNKLDKDEQLSVTKELFGEEAMSSMGMLISNTKFLQENFKLVGDSSKYSGSVLKEYNNKLDTTATDLKLVGKSLATSAADLTQIFLPPIRAGAKGIQGFAEGLSKFSEEWPNTTKALAFGTAGFVGLKLGVSGAVLGIGQLAKTKDDLIFLKNTAMLVKEWKMWGPMLGGLKTGITALGAAGKFALFNPWIMGGAAAIAIGFAVYKNWDAISSWFKVKSSEIKDSFTSSWNGVKEGFGTTISYIKQGAGVAKEVLLSGLVPGYAIYKNWDKIKEGFTSTFDYIGDKIDWLSEKWEKFNVIGRAKEWTKEKWDSFKGGNIPAYAKGGVVNKPHLAIVGDASESIIPHDGSKRSKRLWFDAGRRMGMFAGEGFPSLAAKVKPNITAGSSPKIEINAPFNPVISGVNGSVEDELSNLFSEYKGDLKELILQVLSEHQRNERRVSFV